MISEKKHEYISALTKKCESGDVWAMEELASFYYEDNPDLMSADTVATVLDYYEKSALGGNLKSILNLGTIYFDGIYTAQSYQRAIELFKKALIGDAGRIAAIACSRLAECYRFGLGVEKNLALAFDYYLKGSLLCSHPSCLCGLGDMYREGLFVNKNETMAYFIYCKAKKQSEDRFANYALADTLLRLAEVKIEAVGVERDIAEAKKYIMMAKRIPTKLSHSKSLPSLIEKLENRIKEL